MEPVILFIAITAIISGTIIRAKKINLERERLHLMSGMPPEEASRRGLVGHQAAPQLPAQAASKAELEEIRKRLENLEVIAIDSIEQATANTVASMQEEIKKLQRKIKEMEEHQQI